MSAPPRQSAHIRTKASFLVFVSSERATQTQLLLVAVGLLPDPNVEPLARLRRATQEVSDPPRGDKSYH